MDKDTINTYTVQELANIVTPHAVSIYLTTHIKSSPANRQDAVELKNMLDEAAKKLQKIGMKPEPIHAMLADAYALGKLAEFWKRQSRGLVMFIAPGFFRYYRVPSRFPLQCIVSTRFYIKPLMPLVTDNRSFYILSISKNNVQFYKADRYTIQNVPVDNLPENMKDALWFKDISKELQFHTGTTGRQHTDRSAVFHGHAGWKDKEQTYIVQYFRQIDDALSTHLAKEPAPLVLNTINAFVPLYRKASSYANIHDESIEGNPDDIHMNELQKRGWKIVSNSLKKETEANVKKYRDLSGTQYQAAGIEQIIRHAHDGRVATLFIQKNVHIWGRFSALERKVYIDPRMSPDNMELLNLAAIDIIKKGGTAFVLPKQEMPDHNLVSAILRY